MQFLLFIHILSKQHSDPINASNLILHCCVHNIDAYEYTSWEHPPEHRGGEICSLRRAPRTVSAFTVRTCKASQALQVQTPVVKLVGQQSDELLRSFFWQWQEMFCKTFVLTVDFGESFIEWKHVWRNLIMIIFIVNELKSYEKYSGHLKLQSSDQHWHETHLKQHCLGLCTRDECLVV